MNWHTAAAPPGERSRRRPIGRRLLGGAGSTEGGARASGPARLLLRRARGALAQIPRAAWICALVATLNAACWSIIAPPFQAVDEPAHFAYVQQLAENHRLPTSNSFKFAEEEETVLRDLRHKQVEWHPETPTFSSAAEQRRLTSDLAEHPSRRGDGAAGGASNDPPLFYLLETMPYVLASSGTLLDQLEAMRLLSALMAGLTALFVFLFVRETLPSFRWAWTVGGLSVALAPSLGFMSGVVNPDAMLFAVSAAIFYCLARGFRRGLTHRLAVAIGLLTVAGYLTKLNFIGLIPGVILALTVLTVRAARTQGRRSAWTSFAAALGLAAGPVCLYALANLLSNRAALGTVSTTLRQVGGVTSISAELSYVWQYYLPRLPGMTTYFPGLSMARLWFDRSVGLYGWLDTSFPVWVDNLALVPAALLALLGVRAAVVGRTALRRRLAEISVYGTMGVGLMAVIGATSYFNNEHANFVEPRYLLPLLPLLGVALALAARGAGRRWGPAAGALIVVLFLAHNIFSQLLVVSRFYG